MTWNGWQFKWDIYLARSLGQLPNDPPWQFRWQQGLPVLPAQQTQGEWHERFLGLKSDFPWTSVPLDRKFMKVLSVSFSSRSFTASPESASNCFHLLSSESQALIIGHELKKIQPRPGLRYFMIFHMTGHCKVGMQQERLPKQALIGFRCLVVRFDARLLSSNLCQHLDPATPAKLSALWLPGRNWAPSQPLSIHYIPLPVQDPRKMSTRWHSNSTKTKVSNAFHRFRMRTGKTTNDSNRYSPNMSQHYDNQFQVQTTGLLTSEFEFLYNNHCSSVWEISALQFVIFVSWMCLCLMMFDVMPWFAFLSGLWSASSGPPRTAKTSAQNDDTRGAGSASKGLVGPWLPLKPEPGIWNSDYKRYQWTIEL